MATKVSDIGQRVGVGPRAEHPYRKLSSFGDGNQHGGSYVYSPGKTERDGANRCSPEEVRSLWRNLPADDMVFCPISGWDLRPLRLVSEWASVFVLVDWRFGPGVFDKGIWSDLKAGKYAGLQPSDVDTENPIIAIPDEEVRMLSGPSSDFGMFDEPAWVAGEQPWCRMAQVSRCSGGSQRVLRLVYMVGNCVEIYQRLFVEREVAPKLLWLEWPLSADNSLWERFISGEGEFGRVFTSATVQPRFVVAHHWERGWQHKVACKRLKGCHHAFDLTFFGQPSRVGRRSF